jgi:hypothetical protein
VFGDVGKAFSNAVSGISDGIGNAFSAAGCLLADIGDALSSFDYGTLLAGSVNVVVGTVGTLAGATVTVTGALVSYVVPPAGVAIMTIGAVATVWSGLKVLRGLSQVFRDPHCLDECTPWGNTKRFVRGVLPKFLGGR